MANEELIARLERAAPATMTAAALKHLSDEVLWAAGWTRYCLCGLLACEYDWIAPDKTTYCIHTVPRIVTDDDREKWIMILREVGEG